MGRFFIGRDWGTLGQLLHGGSRLAPHCLCEEDANAVASMVPTSLSSFIKDDDEDDNIGAELMAIFY